MNDEIYIPIEFGQNATWSRAFDLVKILPDGGFRVVVDDESNIRWKLSFPYVQKYQWTHEEAYYNPAHLPIGHAFYEVKNSIYLGEVDINTRIWNRDNPKHYLLLTYDDIFDVIAKDYVAERIEK